MLKIRSYLMKIQNVFFFIDGLCKKVYRTCAVLTAAAMILVVVSLSSKSFKGSGKNNVTPVANRSSSEALQDETDIDVDMFNVSLPENEVDTLESQSIVEDVFLTACADDEAVSIEFSGIEKEPEAVISQNVTNMVAAPIFTSKINLNDEEYNCLLKIVEAEASGCDDIGKILVANVIMNRVNSPKYPNSVINVVFAPKQFSPITDGRYYSVTVRQSTIDAVNRALNGEDYSQGALYFASTGAVASGRCWAANNLRTLFEHDGHVFFAP